MDRAQLDLFVARLHRDRAAPLRRRALAPDGAAAGLLCGAWGFTFCLNYRALFWRVEVLLAGGGTPALETMTQVLAGLLLVSLAAFLATLALCNPSGRTPVRRAHGTATLGPGSGA